MFTKNYYVLQALNMRSIFEGVTSGQVPGVAWESKCGQLKSLDGVANYFNTGMYLPTLNTSNYSGALGALWNNMIPVSSGNIIVGSSDKAENIEDYKLDSEITQLTVAQETTFTYLGYMDSGKSEILLTKSFTNNTENAIIIKEVGYSQKYKFISAVSGNKDLDGIFLMARNVLSNPITVQPGETVTVSMTLDL